MKSPKTGHGVNAWTHRRVLALLRQKVAPDRIREIITREAAECGRDVQQDITHSLSTAPRYLEHERPCPFNGGYSASVYLPGMVPAWAGMQGSNPLNRRGLRSLFPLKTLPGIDPELRERVLKRYACTLEWWHEAWDYKAGVSSADALLGLFGSGEHLVCVGKSSTRFWTEPLRRILARPKGVRDLQFIVPTPMHKLQGTNNQGRLSFHSEDNVAARWHLVGDFDSGTMAEQAAVIRALAEQRKLRMVLYSGGKSLHAWFDAYDFTEKANRRFFRYACRLGADPRMWGASQFARIPGGTNQKTGKGQTIEYYAE